MTQLHRARVKAGTRAGGKAKNRTSRSRRNLRVRSRLEPSSPGCRSRQRRTTKRMVCGPKGAAKEKWAERGNTLPRFSAARGYRRGHVGASPQAALASRREDGVGEGVLASLHRRPISSCAAGLWIQPRPCKQSGSNLSSKATARQLANLPDRASSRARACTRCKVSLKSRLSRVIQGSLARARGEPPAP